MKEPLFYNNQKRNKEDVIDRLDYFVTVASQGLEKYKINKSESLAIAKDLRKELEIEYHNNDLMHTRKSYSTHKFFDIYTKYIHKAFVSITGVLSYKKLSSFLCSIISYLDECKIRIEDEFSELEP